MAVTEQAASRAAHDPPRAIFVRFLRFGALAWGGPAAQIAMIKQECVDEEGWVDEGTFKKTGRLPSPSRSGGARVVRLLRAD